MKSYFSNSIEEKLRPREAEPTESARSHRVRLVSVPGTSRSDLCDTLLGMGGRSSLQRAGGFSRD